MATLRIKDKQTNQWKDVIGLNGKSAYQSYLDTTTDNPPKSEEEWAKATEEMDAITSTEIDDITTIY